MAVPLGFCLVVVRLVQSLLHDINSLRAGRRSSKATSCSIEENVMLFNQQLAEIELGSDFYLPVLLFVVLCALARSDLGCDRSAAI